MAIFLLLLGEHPIYLILFSASMFIALTTTLIVMVAWRIAWILWYSNITARTSRATAAAAFQRSLLPNRGLDVWALRSLPRAEYDARVNAKLTECPICLMEFVNGEVIRVLPHCRHGFHVDCIDTWLKCQSSCPSCRNTLGIGRYQKNCVGL